MPLQKSSTCLEFMRWPPRVLAKFPQVTPEFGAFFQTGVAVARPSSMRRIPLLCLKRPKLLSLGCWCRQPMQQNCPEPFFIRDAHKAQQNQPVSPSLSLLSTSNLSVAAMYSLSSKHTLSASFFVKQDELSQHVFCQSLGQRELCLGCQDCEASVPHL